ncbi:PRC-barrel domain-containing protein [Azospirillum canadense]|uniref:PRC-barrel domain-containing protein n=1 Tax=Azospirillum canadense TaxID=403962 RepID=UPI00222676BB|nr:PRC-barrel domain-containing protein [Azospirillum canadense]MCW2236060.1 sporulation protein YlmC with PRC-barrel domain [Azospirillum canadense]
MRKMVLTTLSALALTTGVAAAQSTAQPNAAGSSPATTQATSPTATSPTARPMNMPGAASVDQLMNRTVVGSDGERIGKVTDVILGPDGHAQLLVIQSGGFLGIGGKTVAADIALADVQPGEDSIKLRDMTQASVRDMPEFQYDDSMTSLNRSPRRSGEQNKQ